MTSSKKISNILKFNQEPIYFPDRPNEVKYSNCSAQKARKVLGYKTEFDVETSLKNMVDYITGRRYKMMIQVYEYIYGEDL